MKYTVELEVNIIWEVEKSDLDGSRHVTSLCLLLCVGERFAFHDSLHVLPIGGDMWKQNIFDCLQNYTAHANLGASQQFIHERLLHLNTVTSDELCS